jgi:hypothetical protein
LYNTKTASNGLPVTATEYRTLQEAYDYFNEALFDGSLPQVLITLQRKARAYGYFSAGRFRRRGGDDERIHEVALNPDGFTGRPDEDILSTLVHEQAHVWQKEYGKCGRGRYHNRQWARKMHEIGLMPSSTGLPGGRPTGDRVSHYILEDGKFIAECRAFMERYKLVWESAITVAKQSGEDEDEAGAEDVQTRAKFTCPNCGLNVWAKPSARVDCHDCSADTRETILMLSVPARSALEMIYGNDSMRDKTFSREVSVQ